MALSFTSQNKANGRDRGPHRYRRLAMQNKRPARFGFGLTIDY